MAFPVTPADGQTTVVNNVTYQYSTATTAWTRINSTVTSLSSLLISNGTVSTSTTTGALLVTGGVGIGGNLNVGGTITAGTVSGGGVRTTTTSTAPANPAVGDIWYWSGVDTIMRYTNDGVSSYWIDITGPTANLNTGVVASGGVSISSVVVTNSSYVPRSPATSYISTTGNYVTILGTGFTAASQLYIQGNLVTSTTYVNPGQINAQIPAYNTSSVTTQQIYIANTASNSAGILITGFGYGVSPYWTIGNSLTGATPSINVNLSALSDSTMTYAVLSGTVPSGLTFSTSTGILSGTYNTGTSTTLVIQAVNVQNQSNTQTFTITILAADPYFYETTLLLNGETSTSTWIADASTNTFALSTGGTGLATPNRFSPLWGSGYYGVSFDGSTGYLKLPFSSTTLGSNNFTIEGWVYPANTSKALFAGGQSDLNTAAGSAWAAYINAGATTSDLYQGAGSYSIASPSVPANIWSHVAFVRNGSSWTSYVNGVQYSTIGGVAGSVNVGTATYQPTIGAFANGSNFFSGYISNFRIVIGTAVYTSAFIPPTSPLTAIVNTTILTCLTNNISDISPNTIAITPVGTVKVAPNQPFGSLPASTTANTGYSTYFDGSSGFLSIATNSALSWGGSNNGFIECWIYILSSNQTSNIVSKSDVSGVSYANWQLALNSGKLAFVVSTSGAPGTLIANIVGATTLPINTWVHVAGSRNYVGGGSQNVYIVYVNGAVDGSLTGTSPADNSPTAVTIGKSQSASNYFSGYMSNLRMSNTTIPAGYQTGSVATTIAAGGAPTNGTSVFTPSTTPLNAITGTFLLTLQSSIIADASTSTFTITPSGTVKVVNNTYPFTSPATTVTSVTSFGSAYLDGNSYISVPGSAFVFGTNPFTIEFWVFPTVASEFSGGAVVVDNFVTGASYTVGQWQLEYTSTGGISFNVATSTSAAQTLSGGSSTVNAWTHFALVRTGTGTNQTSIYINGVSVAVGTFSQSIGVNATSSVGRQTWSNSYYFVGNVSGLRTVNGTAIYTSNFAPPIAPLTTSTTTALLTLQYKQGNTNNVFYDDSVNNFAITRNGTPTQGTFSPFSPTGWSVYYGSSNYWQAPASTNWDITSGAFTVEMFVYLTGYTGDANQGVYLIGNFTGAGGASGWDIGLTYGATPTLGLTYWNGAGGTGIGYSGTVVPLNQWVHLAVTRSVSTIYFYVNGVLASSAAAPTIAAGDKLTSGAYVQNFSYPSWVYGSISNLRIIKGTALYSGSSSFTVPTSPLTAVANTVFLGNQSNRFVDNGPNAVAITISGAPSVQAFSPFPPGVVYSPATHGGSMYFNGSTDYFTVAFPAISAGVPFTLEMWIYATASQSNANGISLFSNLPNGLSLTISGTSNANNLNFSKSGVANYITNAGAITLNAWNHAVLTRNTTTTAIFLNGVRGGTSTDNSAFVAGTYSIGYNNAAGTYFGPGYMSNLRFVIGQDIYGASNTTLTMPTAPTALTTTTSLLLLGTNAGIIDQSSRNDLITVGSATISTSVKKYGTGSMLFNGSTDYLRSPSSTLHDLNASDFTIEFWVYFNSVGSNQGFVSKYGNTAETAGGQGYFLDWLQSSTSLRFVLGTVAGVTDNVYTWSWSPSINTWYHVAVTRSGSSARTFINGTQIGTTTTVVTNDIASPAPLQVGKINGVTNYLNGYMDDLRITKGYARYTANFTPPVSQFPAQ